MRRLFVFNPETDYCLASDLDAYTPPANVANVRRSFAMTPLSFASPGDALLIIDSPPSPGEAKAADDAGVELFTPGTASAQRSRLIKYLPTPWGWNRHIRHLLLRVIGRMPGIPSEQEIATLRRLSHRRTNIRMFSEMKPRISASIDVPVEIDNTSDALAALRLNGRLYFKAPWSSSGRGILLADSGDSGSAEKWIAGTIRRQGSVIMEKAYDRALDFATEWYCNAGKISFLGYSVFNASDRGKYQSNVVASQDELLNMIRAAAPEWSDSFLTLQKHALERIFGSEYNGPLGVDMLATCEGYINPSVEVNLRHTMGMPGLLKYRNL